MLMSSALPVDQRSVPEDPATFTVELVTDATQLEQLVEPWRQLAHVCACPGALPEWLLSWWHHVAPRRAELRTVTVFDSNRRLVGLAPLFAVPHASHTAYRLLGAPYVHRLAPLAQPGSEAEVVCAIAKVLSEADPRPDVVMLDGIEVGAPWLETLTSQWTGRVRPWSYTVDVVSAPTISLAGTFEEWLATRSSKFRQQMRRARRAVEQAGGQIVLPTVEPEVERGCAAFARLHAERWSGNDTPSYLTPAWFAAIRAAALPLAARGELRLWLLELQGRVVAVELSLAAGGEVQFFNGGWDASAAKFSPALLIRLAAVEDAFSRGEHRLDMGGGRHEYKLRFATGEAPIAFGGLVPRTTRYPLTRLELVAEQTARRLVQRLSYKQKVRLKKLLRRDEARPGSE